MTDYKNDDFAFDYETPLTRQDVQREVLSTLRALQESAAVVAQRNNEALKRAEEKFPGFLERYSSPETCRRFVAENPRTANRLLAVEAGLVGDAQDLGEHYRIFAEKTAGYQPTKPTKPSNPAPGTTAPQVVAQPLSSSEARRAFIKAFEEKHGDVPIDEFDPENPRYKRERGEG